MLDLVTVAVTGSLASGKTSVCTMLEKYGACVIHADSIVHELLSHNISCIARIVELLGPKVTVEGHIESKVLAQIVFNDRKKLNDLESILHPLVLEEIQKKYYEVAQDKNCTLFVVEVPLLFEVNWHTHFDYVILVVSDPEICLKRAQNKGLSEVEFNKRSARFLPSKVKEALADFIVINNKDLKSLESQIETIVKVLKKNHSIEK